jgi:catechol 2,3-dioxygenase-like lactoylglutathione lyase family enzyme
MLKDWPTRCLLPALSLERARSFYERILGLRVVEIFPGGGIDYNAGGTRITIFPAGVGSSGHHTQLGFDVQDIRAVVIELEDKGIIFEDYEMPGHRMMGGHLINVVPYLCAWFKDTEGNSLGIWEIDSAPSGAGARPFVDCVSQTNLPAHDMPRARRFYEGKLGFRMFEEVADGGVTYEAGGSQFIVSPTTVEPSREHPQIAFDVREPVAEAEWLRNADVSVEELPEPYLGSVGARKGFSFRDSEGNLLTLVGR